MPPAPAPVSPRAAPGLSIRARILLLMLAVLMPAAAALAWLLASDLRNAQQAAYARVRVLADATAAGVGGALQRGQDTLARMALRPALLTMDPRQCDPVIAGLATLDPEFPGLTVRDLQGREVCRYCCTEHSAALASPADVPYFAATIGENGFGISDVFREPTSGRQSVALSRPLVDADGTRLGVLSLIVDLQTLNQRLLGATPAEVVVMVLNRHGNIVLRSAQPEAFIGAAAPGSALQADTAAADGRFDGIGRDGVRRLFAVASLPDTGWRVFAGLPEAQVFAEYRRVLTHTIVVGLGVSLLALGLALALSTAIARPIARLRHSAARVAAGDTSARAVDGGPPEVQLLAQTFNHMLDQRTLAEARLQSLFDTSFDAILTADEDQRIVQANAAATALLACPAESIVGSRLERFVPQTARAAHPAAVRAFGESAVAARHMGLRREVSALRADGTEFPVEATISHLSVDGAPLYTVMLRDLTAARQAEKALSSSEAQQRLVLMNLPEAVFVSRGNRIALVNQAAQRLFGGDESALLGRPPLGLIDVESQPKVLERIAALTPDNPAAGLSEVKIVRLDGERRTVEALGTLVGHDGQRSIVVVLRDVTELRLAQAALQASHADLRRLVAELDRAQDIERRRIARELHDDLQQTLAAIRMDASMLRDHAPGAPADAAAAVARIDELAATAITSTRRLIDDLRPQALEELGLVPALKTMARDFAQRIGVRCEVIASDVAARTEPHPQVATCLYRVAQEALNNVAKHAHARQVRITLAAQDDGCWRLCVHDDGRGMNPADRRKTRSFGLLGMQERVRALGGEFGVESEPGRGTSVRVSVPASGAAAVDAD